MKKYEYPVNVFVLNGKDKKLKLKNTKKKKKKKKANAKILDLTGKPLSQPDVFRMPPRAIKLLQTHRNIVTRTL